MKKVLIGNIGNFYKANLHSHTTISDGCLTPEQMVKAYKKEGYQILSITDHRTFVTHNDLTSKDFLLLNGIEIDVNKGDKYKAVYHLNLFAKNDSITEMFSFSPEYSVDNINKIISDANNLGFLVQYNHPRWSHQYVDDFVNLKGLWGFEIFNGATELEHLAGRADFEYETFGRINQDDESFPVASSDDDNHNAHGHKHEPLCDSYIGFNMIEAKELTYDCVIDAMVKGNMYASMGPLINYLSVNGDKVLIKTSDCMCVVLLNEKRQRDTIWSAKPMNKATLKIPAGSKWFRIQVVDKFGKIAYTNIYKL